MQSLEWTEDVELFSPDHESWRNFQISKKKFDKRVPEDYEFRCKGKCRINNKNPETNIGFKLNIKKKKQPSH